MFRIYLDHNVFTHLRQKKETVSPYRNLYSFIKRNRDKLFFVYSPSHLQDLKRSSNSIYTEQDLEFINELTNGCYISERYKAKTVHAGVSHPKKYFESIKNDTTLEYFDFETIFSDSDSPEITKLWQALVNLLKSTPSGLNDDFFKSLDNTNYSGLKKFFENTQKDNSLYSVFKDTFSVIANPEEHSKTYIAFRNKSIDDMKLNPNPSEWGNAFEYLDKAVAKSSSNSSFREMIEKNLKITKKEGEISTFDYFINYYISLDSFGFYKDKQLQNLIDDAMHAYYGAFCDYFVTDDNRTYQKAKAIYENFNIGTRVCKSEDFANEFYKENVISTSISEENITSRVVEVLQNSLIMLESVDDELNPATVYKVCPPLADYFTRLQVTHYKESTVLLFYKKANNYSAFLFWDEIRAITNKFSNDYGIDDNLRLNFDPAKEEKEISENVWPGREWKRGQLHTSVFYNTSLNDITFRIELLR